MITMAVITVECSRENVLCLQLLADEANGLIPRK